MVGGGGGGGWFERVWFAGGGGGGGLERVGFAEEDSFFAIRVWRRWRPGTNADLRNR